MFYVSWSIRSDLCSDVFCSCWTTLDPTRGEPVWLSKQETSTPLIRGRSQRLETPPGKTSATKFCGSKQFPAMTEGAKLSCHERGVPEVGFRLMRTNNEPNHGAVRSQSSQKGPRARRGSRMRSRAIGVQNARWGRGTGARTAHRTSASPPQGLLGLARRQKLSRVIPLTS